MADKKISQLTTLVQANVDVTADFLPIVDTGAVETKKVTPQALVQAGATGATLALADGAAATPSLTNTGDENTGIFFPAADTIAASVGGVEGWRLDSSGNLGIGTSSPGAKLEVTGDIQQTWATSMDRFIGSKFSTTFELGLHFLESGRETRVVSKAADSTDKITFYTGVTPAERMRLDSSGNLGIGTSSPGSRLEVNGTSNLGGTAAAPRVGVGTFAAGVASMNAGGGNALQIGTTGASEMALFQNNAAIVRLLGSNMGLRTTDCGASAVGCFGIANATTVPTGAPAGGGVIYVEAGALKYRGSSGTVTTIANA
jgi:hypothetical protein